MLSKKERKTIQSVQTKLYFDHFQSISSHEKRIMAAWLQLHLLLWPIPKKEKK